MCRSRCAVAAGSAPAPPPAPSPARIARPRAWPLRRRRRERGPASFADGPAGPEPRAPSDGSTAGPPAPPAASRSDDVGHASDSAFGRVSSGLRAELGFRRRRFWRFVKGKASPSSARDDACPSRCRRPGDGVPSVSPRGDGPLTPIDVERPSRRSSERPSPSSARDSSAVGTSPADRAAIRVGSPATVDTPSPVGVGPPLLGSRSVRDESWCGTNGKDVPAARTVSSRRDRVPILGSFSVAGGFPLKSSMLTISLRRRATRRVGPRALVFVLGELYQARREAQGRPFPTIGALRASGPPSATLRHRRAATSIATLADRPSPTSGNEPAPPPRSKAASRSVRTRPSKKRVFRSSSIDYTTPIRRGSAARCPAGE